jgi:Asp/Glu/hydantoin racemase
MIRKLAFIHASPAAIGPLAQFYAAHAPELEITNLLDDGLLRWFTTGEWPLAERRFVEMLRTGRETYGADAALITCSAIPTALLEALRAAAGMPVLKIDEPMARLAVSVGNRVGVAVTFPPTVESTRALLLQAAAEAGRPVEIAFDIAEGAYDALQRGDFAHHDNLLLGAVERLAAGGADAIVLAQVSMARVLDRARTVVPVPVFSSLETSLDAVRQALEARA